MKKAFVLKPFTFFQDIGDFNIATSSLHALSNSMQLTRSENHQSPHSSPRLSRRTPGTAANNIPSTVSSSNGIQSEGCTNGGQNQIHSVSMSNLASAASSSHNINGNLATHTNIVLHSQQQQFQKSTNKPLNSSYGGSSQHINSNTNTNNGGSNGSGVGNMNRMSAPMAGTSANLMNKLLNKAASADIPTIHASLDGINQDPTAPPLPPRKTSPGIDNSVNRQLKPQSINTQNQSPNPNSIPTGRQTVPLSQSSENVNTVGAETNEFEVPRTTAPPVPKHQTTANLVDSIVTDMLQVDMSSDESTDCDKIIVGPAETITGIIDTRPLEQRKPISVGTTTQSNGQLYNGPTDKDAILVVGDRNNINNLYQLKTNYSQTHAHTLNHVRHQSLPFNNSSAHQLVRNPLPTTAIPPPKSVTTSQLKSLQEEQQKLRQSATTNNLQQAAGPSSSVRTAPLTPLLLYENVAMSECNVPYENINLEYINRLMKEGYSKESVVTALGISRNNIEMACDILHEFVSKGGGA
jgi:E3 ubiquitin-protein ligase CBL